jgi:hypothetical protein
MNDADRIAIEWECTKLINVYALRNDAGDWDSVAALYAQDGLMTRPSAPDKPVVGREAILAGFKARPARAGRHVVSNIVVDVESATQASGYSVILLFQGEASADGGLPVRDPKGPLVGYFKDRFTKTAEGWRFSERRGGLDFAP